MSYEIDDMDDHVFEVKLAAPSNKAEYLHNLLVWMFCGVLTAFAGYGCATLVRITYLAIRLWVRR